MNIVHIGTADNDGGAARAAFRLHLGLQDLAHSSKILAGHSVEKRPEINVIPKSTLWQKQLTRIVRRFETYSGLQYLTIPWKNQFLNHPFFLEADIVNFHNLHGGFFSHSILPKISAHKPIVWTLHDVWSMTGHCTYPQLYLCDKWKTGCGRCPALDDYPPISIDTTAFLWKLKKKFYQASHINIVAPSRWLFQVAKTSPLLSNFPIHHIPYGLDETIFQPYPIQQTREELKIPKEKKAILFTAQGVHNPRKGFHYLKNALKRLHQKRTDLLLLTLGEGKFTLEDQQGLPPTINFPFISDDNQMAKIYSCADIYVTTALADNLPNTVLESLACGTPVIGFRVGGIPDMVHHNMNGFITTPGDENELENTLNSALNNNMLHSQMRENARETILKNYTLKIQANRYVNLYKQLLENKKSGSVQENQSVYVA